MRTLVFGLTAAVAALSSTPASASVFIDTFNGYSPSLAWNGSGVWTTGNSVDLVSSGSYNLKCVGGIGNCVDLSGSSPGSISQLIALAAGNYRLTFKATGNQLDAFGGPFPQSSINYSIGSLTNGSTGTLTNTSSAFQTFNGLFTVTGNGGATLSFSQAPGGDPYRGSILDSVSIAAVPEPATWAMLIIGFGMVGGAMRYRRKGVAAVA